MTSAEFETALKVRDATGTPVWARKDAEERVYQERQYAEFCALTGIPYEEDAVRLAEIVGVDVADVQRVVVQPDAEDLLWAAWARLEGFAL